MDKIKHLLVGLFLEKLLRSFFYNLDSCGDDPMAFLVISSMCQKAQNNTGPSIYSVRRTPSGRVGGLPWVVPWYCGGWVGSALMYVLIVLKEFQMNEIPNLVFLISLL